MTFVEKVGDYYNDLCIIHNHGKLSLSIQFPHIFHSGVIIEM